MDGYTIPPDLAKTSWPVVAGSLWLRLGVFAAAGAIVALTELYKGEIGVVAALAWIFGGAGVTAVSWRRAKALLLDQPDDDVAEIETVTSESTNSIATGYASWDRREIGATPVTPSVRV
jgi:hypothetical protein